MKKSYNKSKKNFLALLLSVFMVTSCAAVASCGESNVTDSSSSSTEEDNSTSVIDTGLIKNANFKTADNKKGLHPIVTSVTGWGSISTDSVGGTSATGSQSRSGILNTDKDAWKKLVRSDKNVEISVEEAKNQWEKICRNGNLRF